MKQACKIFVITLRDFPERLAAFQKQARQLGLDYEVVYGTAGYKLGRLNLVLANLPRLLAFRPSLSPGMVGCCASHMRILKKMASEGIEYALILEDDAFFAPSFTAETIRQFDSKSIPFDLFFLGYNDYDYRDFSLGPSISFGSMDGQKIHGYMPYGTVGCIVHRRMAIKRLRQPFYIEEPIDHYWRLGSIEAYAAAPFMLSPDLNLFSVIRGKVRGDGSTKSIVINRTPATKHKTSLQQKLGNVARNLIVTSGLAVVLKALQAHSLEI